MKKIKLISILFILPCLILGGCQNKTFEYQLLQRDNYNTGGNLTFVYDEISHTAIFGGDGETVQFYSKDIAKGWDKEGCRVGVQIPLPNDVEDFKSGSAVLDGKKISAQEFVIHSDETTPQYALFQPLVSKEKSQINLKVTWQDGFEEQSYLIIIKEGTEFMQQS